MANKEHEKILNQGVRVWNDWRKQNTNLRPDLCNADLYEKDLAGIDFNNTDLAGAELTGANLTNANLSNSYLLGLNNTREYQKYVRFDRFFSSTNFNNANLQDAIFAGAYLKEANFTYAKLKNSIFTGAELSEAVFYKADLSNSRLVEANLTNADFNHAVLREANLSKAILINTNFESADLSNCKVYGIAAWDLKSQNSIQNSLQITPTDTDSPIITVDNLEIAQFIYLLLENKKIRNVIDTITSKVVLILGRFKPERKVILDAIRDELRKNNYLPVLFDFEKPCSRDSIETISTIAHMSRFVIADLTEAKSVLQELEIIVPNLPSVPVKPIINNTDCDPGMFDHFRQYRSVLEIHRYNSSKELISSLYKSIIVPAKKAYDKLHKK